MKFSLKQIVIILSLVLALLIFVFFNGYNTKLSQAFALTTLGYLYFTLIIDPLYFLFTKLPKENELKSLKNTTGKLIVFFAIAHIFIAFFLQLGGFAGFEFLSNNYQSSILIGLASLILILIFTIFSLNFLGNKLKRFKKVTDKLLYVAGILTILHALKLGTHFAEVNSIFSYVILFLISILVLFELIRLDSYLRTKFIGFKFSSLLTFLLLGIYLFSVNGIYNSTNLSVHSTHKSTAEFDGNFNSEFIAENGKINIKIFNSQNGEFIKKFTRIHGEIMHLIIIESNFENFYHLHPLLTDGEFSTEFNFAKGTSYKVYFSFQPQSFNEQLNSYSVGTIRKEFSKENKYIAEDRNYSVYLDEDSTKADTLKFRVLNKENNFEVRNIESYLQALGHLVIVNSSTYDYYHVHPQELKPYELGGPQLDFMLEKGKLSKGNYFAYLQFQIEGELYLVKFNFTI